MHFQLLKISSSPQNYDIIFSAVTLNNTSQADYKKEKKGFEFQKHE